MSEPLTILFEDNHVLALLKPAGLLTQGPPAVPSLEARAKDYLKTTYSKTGRVYLGVPHRLDRPVSGVVVFARNTKAAGRLAEQFRERQVQKVYWAVVEGAVSPAEGAWRDWLRKWPLEARTEVLTEEQPGAKLGELAYRVRRPLPGPRTLLELRPLTGRMHQLRVQCASRGHAVLGDETYGSQTPFGPPAALPRDRIIALHARELTILHPIRYEPMTLTAPLSSDWHDVIGDEEEGAAFPSMA